MRWLAKAAVHWAISAAPGGVRLKLRRYFQERSGELPASECRLEILIANATTHFTRPTAVSPLREDATYFECGVGGHVFQALIFWSLGMRRQTLVDIQPWLQPDLLNDAISRLRLRGYETPSYSVEDPAALRLFGIDYQAPADARRTSLPSGSVRYIATTNVFEHVSKDSVLPILKECHGLLSGDGAVSLRIDYVDHYSYFDRRVPSDNFLRYSDFTWRFLNPPTHYQNRLRHRDYLEMIRRAGFSIASEELARDERTSVEAHSWLLLTR